MNSRINVLQVVDKLSLGGSTKHGVAQLFSWWFPLFDRSRFNVTLCSLRGRDKAGEYLESLGVEVIYLNRAKIDPRAFIDLLRLVKEKDIHVLHLHGYGATSYGRLCTLLTRVPSIVHEHMTDQNIPGYQQIADWLLSKSTSFGIAVSQSVKEFMVEKRRVPAHLVQVIYNGAPLSIYQPHRLRVTVGAGLSGAASEGLVKETPVVAIIGRLHPVKGHLYFLEAAQQVLREIQDVNFWVVGDGELMEDLKFKARALEIEDKVLFTGYREDIADLLKQIDIKVIASLSEGVPLTLFEAMAAGCPVVSTAVGGIPEILQDGLTGLLAPPKDPEALAEKILVLLRDPELGARMSCEAQIKAQQYDVCNTVQKFQSIYSELARRLVGRSHQPILFS